MRSMGATRFSEEMDLFDRLYNWGRWGLGGVFIYAGSVKLMAPGVFAVLIGAYGILPESLIMPAAIVLPALEVAAGVGLLFDLEGSLAIIAGLLGLFIPILAYGLSMGLDVDCGCFGPEDLEAKAFHGLRTSLYRDLAMLAWVVFFYGWRRYRVIRTVRLALLADRLFKKRRRKDAHV